MHCIEVGTILLPINGLSKLQKRITSKDSSSASILDPLAIMLICNDCRTILIFIHITLFCARSDLFFCKKAGISKFPFEAPCYTQLSRSCISKLLNQKTVEKYMHNLSSMSLTDVKFYQQPQLVVVNQWSSLTTWLTLKGHEIV